MPDKSKKSKHAEDGKNNSTNSVKKQAIHRNKVVMAIVIVIVVLFAVAGTIYYFSIRQNPSNVVMDAVIKTAEADNLSATGTMKGTLGQFDGKINVEFSSVKANKDGSFDAKITYKSNQIKKPLTINSKVVIASDGVLYLNADNISGAIATIYKEMGAAYDRVHVQGSETTEQPFAVNSLVVGMGKFLDGKWIKLPIQQNNDSSLNPLSCYQSVFAKYNANSSERSSIIKAYREHDFLIVDDKTLDSEGNSNGYRISVDSEKLEKFKSEVNKTTVGKMLSDCVESDSAKKSVDAGNVDTYALDLWIDKYSHNITHIKTNADKITVDMKLDHGANTKVSIPAEAKTITDIFTKENVKAEVGKN